MSESDITSLLKEADDLGILNIDVDGSQLTPELIRIAINETKLLNLELDGDEEEIVQKIQEADRIYATAQA